MNLESNNANANSNKLISARLNTSSNKNHSQTPASAASQLNNQRLSSANSSTNNANEINILRIEDENSYGKKSTLEPILESPRPATNSTSLNLTDCQSMKL